MSATRLGHHELIERLGHGAMGVVWKAHDRRSDRLVALKILAEQSGGRRFRREFRAARRLDHPNVVRVFETGRGSYEGHERPWFTMELVEGSTLRDHVEREAAGWPPERNSREWLASRLSFLHQVALGLEHCHAHGVLHRDLKPTNVLVTDEGLVKLVDFGLARMDGRPSSLSGAGQLIGTVAYMAPEQARGGQLDARSDVHGLGAIAQELCCGRPPFDAEDLPSLLMQVLFQAPADPFAQNPELEASLASLVTSCLAKEAIDRPQSAGAVAGALEDIARDCGLSLDAGQAGTPSLRPRALAPQLVGREEERRELRLALERARNGPVVVTVSGPSGIGKSRLTQELRVDAELKGFHVLSSGSSASPRPLGSLRELLRTGLQESERQPGTVNDVALLTTVLPELLGDDEERGSAAPADRLRVAWAADAVISSLLRRGPHLLILDDLQWADPLSTEVIERLVFSHEGPLLIVAVFRDDDAEPRPAAERLRAALASRPDSRALALDALGEEEVSRVIESMLGKPPSREVTRQLARATGGMPHDIEQVVRELAARGAVRLEGERLSLDVPAALELSELSASEATRTQLEALGPTAQQVVQAVLLSGRGLHVATLGEALDLEEDELLDQLELLVGEGILRDGPGSDVVSLAHDRLREAFAIGSSADQLAPLRGSLARALERRDATGAAAHRVAELDLAAGAYQEACRTVPPSAEAFAAAGLHAAALERFEALITLAEREGRRAPPQTYLRRAVLLAETGRTEDSVSAYQAIADEPAMRELMPPWAARRQMAFSLMLLTRLDEAVEALERGVQEARDAGDPDGEAKGMSVLGTIVDRRGELDRSLALHEGAVSLARERASRESLAMALANLGVFAYRHGRLEMAQACFEEAVAIFTAIGDSLHGGGCRSGLAGVLLARGEPASARLIAREVVESMRRDVDVRGLSRALELVALASLALGEADEAESLLSEALAIRARLGEPWAEGETYLNLASVATYRCRWDEASSLLGKARALFETAADAGRLARVSAREGHLAWRRRRAEARGLLEAARVSAQESSELTALTESQLDLARLEADEGRAQAACSRLREALTESRATQLQVASLESELLACRAMTGEVDGLADDARRIAAGFERRPAAEGLLDGLACAAAFRVLGDAEASERSLAFARRLMSRLAADLDDPDAERFSRQHLHVRLLALLGEDDTGADDSMSLAERNELERLRTFRELVMTADPSEPDSLMATFTAAALAELGFERGLIFQSEGSEFACRIARNRGGKEVPASERRVPDQLLQHALERDEPVLSIAVKDDPDLDYAGSVAEMNVEAFAAVPVKTEAGLRLVAYFDGPPPSRDPHESLALLAPVFEDFGQLLERARRLKDRTDRADAIVASMGGAEGPIIGNSRAIEDLRRLIETVAPTDASVLILGENGTGKELVARELHSKSARADGPMLSRSCAELTETLLESELFGHEKGAFTGAERERAGLFEAASGGTLFLDEVGEMSPALQAKLLRVLETGEVTRLGSNRTRQVDVRVVAATHRDLTAGVADGSFRQDLYYRLKVIELRVPALRERVDDLPQLAHHFLALSSTGRDSAPRGFTHEALRALAQHDWPGNVRELRNVVERAVILSGKREEIDSELLPPEIVGEASGTGAAGPAVSGTDLRAAREAFEKACIERALEENGGNRTHAAKALGISVRSLQQKLGRHAIS